MTVTFGKIYLHICVNAPVIVVDHMIWGWEKSKLYKNESMDFAPQLINCGTEGIFEVSRKRKRSAFAVCAAKRFPEPELSRDGKDGIKK